MTLLGPRDPAQPLLTLYAGAGRVELSGATTANWVAKSANLLIDGYGAPERVGLLLPLHWQTVVLLLAGVDAGATVAVVDDPVGLADCDLAFVLAERAEAVVSAGCPEVFALSGHPMGAPLGRLPAMVLDYAREVPSYGDRFPGGPTQPPRIELDGQPIAVLPDLGLVPTDRILTTLDPATHSGLRAGLLAPLAAGAALVLVPDPSGVDLTGIATAERVTATVGIDLPGVRRLA